jgi:hypothetical protein
MAPQAVHCLQHFLPRLRERYNTLCELGEGIMASSGNVTCVVLSHSHVTGQNCISLGVLPFRVCSEADLILLF